MRIAKKEILARLYDNIKNDIAIVGSGAGIGLTAKAEELGGTDLIICYNTGYFRMQGRPSVAGLLPLGDANSIMLQMAKEILPVVKKTPVLAGVFANDPFRDIPKLLEEVAELGFSGVQNFPTVGDYEGQMRKVFFSSGFNYDNEVEMIRQANRAGLLTTPFVWSEEDALKMIDAGTDVIVVHASMTVGGMNGADPSLVMSMDQTCEFVQKIRDSAVGARKDIIVLIHGGPVAYPADLEYVMQHTDGIHGFYGASSCERLPVEDAVSARIREFKSVKFSNQTT